ncbi:hypothetical protein EYF80_036164 [Liparis tanakae]|uniref:Uncharacterized protein n=1 Tax=Liparis tanakae TaxID=230148 RepID=A0A4Z2GK17_9TELE|nr:hypothetical protein EYF80_036164 [Liparis tanakae]
MGRSASRACSVSHSASAAISATTVSATSNPSSCPVSGLPVDSPPEASCVTRGRGPLCGSASPADPLTPSCLTHTRMDKSY